MAAPMLDELRTAVAAASWRPALELALAAWRACRATALADLVDRLATRCEPPAAPRQGQQPWWLAHATTYDPVVVTTLAASADTLAHKSEISWEAIETTWGASRIVTELRTAAERAYEAGRQAAFPSRALLKPMFTAISNRNRIARLALMERWPADPRVARVLAGWFAEAAVDWAWPHDGAALRFYELLADELIRHADGRTIAVVQRVVDEPRGRTLPIRDLQRALAPGVVAAIAARDQPLSAPVAGEVARWCPSLTPARDPDDGLDERLLWRDAAGGDLGAHLVLADALLQRGDRRGEIIVLACSEDPVHQRRARSLLDEHWEHWLGELALVLDRGGCHFEHGLLVLAQLGNPRSPDWAFARLTNHRELTTVRAIRPSYHVTPAQYLRSLGALERIPPRLRLASTMVAGLARTRRDWPVRELEYASNFFDRGSPAAAGVPGLVDGLTLAAAQLREVEHLALDYPADHEDELPALVAAAPRLFPRLSRLTIDAARYLDPHRRATLLELAKQPHVVIHHGYYQL
ncbi:MAG: hypothetical protein M3680_09665 [Myxococcota bacterium]|nr:hypothetical protein [Myxococcota bacterium]